MGRQEDHLWGRWRGGKIILVEMDGKPWMWAQSPRGRQREGMKCHSTSAGGLTGWASGCFPGPSEDEGPRMGALPPSAPTLRSQDNRGWWTDSRCLRLDRTQAGWGITVKTKVAFKNTRGILGCPAVRTPYSCCRGVSSIPGPGTRTLSHVVKNRI